VVDEVVFVVGPALVTTLATTVHPLAGLTTAVVATVLGTAVLATQRRTEPPAAGAGRRGLGESMPWRVLAPMIACAFAMGALLGGAEVATVALSEELGATSLAGLMLAVWAVGSLVSGVVVGAVHSRASTAARFRRGMVGLGLLMLPLPFVHGFWMLGVGLFLSGVAISPTLIAGFARIEECVPSGRITEGITLFTTGLGVGLAPGAALVGLVVDRSGASAGFWVPAAAGLLGAAVALVAQVASVAQAASAKSSESSESEREGSDDSVAPVSS
jgi:predicted MFS family arabinose efflux permease